MEKDTQNIQQHYQDIRTIYEKNLSTSFEINNTIQEKLERVRELKDKLYSLIRKIPSIIITEDRLCVNDKYTVREKDIYRYSSHLSARIEKLLCSESLRHEISRHCKKAKDARNIIKTFHLTKFFHDTYQESDFYALVECEIPEKFTFMNGEISEDNYYIIYQPKKSSENQIRITYDYEKSKTDKLERYRCDDGIDRSSHKKLKRNKEKVESVLLKHVNHSQYIEKAVKKSREKIENMLQLLENIIESIEKMFSKAIVAGSI